MILLIFLTNSITYPQDKIKIELIGLKNISEYTVISAIKDCISSLDYVTIKRKIEDLGWFSEIKIDIKKDDHIIRIYVEEFPIINKIIILGNTVFEENEIIDHLGLKIGTVFNKVELYKNIPNLYNAFRLKGFTQNEIDRIELSKEGVLKIFVIEWKIKNFDFKNKFPVDGEKIKNYLLGNSRSPYNTNLFKKKIESLYYTNAFDYIDIKVEKSDTKGKLIAYADIIERPPSLNMKLQYSSFKGLKSRILFHDYNFLGMLNSLIIQADAYKISDNRCYSLDSKLSDLIDYHRLTYLEFNLVARGLSNKELPAFNLKLSHLNEVEFDLNLKMPMLRYFSFEPGFRVAYSEFKYTNGAIEETPFTSVFLRLVYKSSWKEENLQKLMFDFKTDYLKPISDSYNIKYALNGIYEFSLKNFRNIINFSSGIIRGNNIYIWNKFRVGADDYFHYLKYEELFLDEYIFSNYTLQFPYIKHLISFYTFVDYIIGKEHKSYYSLNDKFFGMGAKIANVPVYIDLSFKNKLSFKSAVLTLNLNL